MAFVPKTWEVGDGIPLLRDLIPTVWSRLLERRGPSC